MLKKVFSVVLLVISILFSIGVYLSANNLEMYHNLTVPRKFEASKEELNQLNKEQLIRLVDVVSFDQNQHGAARQEAVDSYNRQLTALSVLGFISSVFCIYLAWSKNA